MPAWFVDDLRFRVVKLRLWGDDQFDGFQFTYRQILHNDEREDFAVTTTRVTKDTLPRHDVELVDGEYIVGFGSVESAMKILTAVVVVTSTGRRFEVGSVAAASSVVVVTEPSTEIRTLTTQRSSSHNAFTSLSTPRVMYPTAAMLETAVNDAVEAGQTKWAYPTECETLVQRLVAVYKAIYSVITRGVVYPVGVAWEFAELARQSTDIVKSCGDSYGFGFMWRRVSYITEYLHRLTTLEAYVLDQLPRAELACIGIGDAVGPLDTEHVPSMIQQCLKTKQIELAAMVATRYAVYLDRAHVPIVHAVVEALVGTEHCALIRRVVDAFASVTTTRVSDVMAPLKGQSSVLIERAIESATPDLLEWLVTKASIDPFYVRPPPAMLGAALYRRCSSVCHSALERAGVVAHVDPLRIRSTSRQAQYEKLQTMLRTLECQPDDAERMTLLLEEIKHQEDFQIGLLTLATQANPVSPNQLLALVPKITSVYDLPLLYSQAVSHLDTVDPTELATIVHASCVHVLTKELTVDTKACVFFDAALDQALARGYLSKFDRDVFHRRNTHVNMVMAPCVQRLQHTFQELQGRVVRLDDQLDTLQRNVRDLRDSLRRKEDAELRRRRCRRGMALVSSMLSMFGGQILTAIHDCIFDLPDASDMLFAENGDDGTALIVGTKDDNNGYGVGRDELASACNLEGEATGVAGFRADVERALKDANIKPTEFLLLMTEGIELAQPQSIVHGKRVAFDEAMIRRFPYHDAVRESRGDLEQFKRLEVPLLKTTKADPHACMSVTVSRVHDNGSTTTTTTPMKPYVFASHVGFVAIVEHLHATRKAKRRHPWKFWDRTRRRDEKAKEGHAAIAG